MYQQSFKKDIHIHFNLRQPKSNQPSMIYAVIYLNGKQSRYSTGVKVFPHHWDKARQRAIISLSYSHRDNRNNQIANQVLDKFSEYFSQYKLELSKELINFAESKPLLDSLMARSNKKKATPKEKPQAEPISWMRLRLDPDNRTDNNYLSCINHLDKWIKASGNTVKTWDDITVQLLSDFFEALKKETNKKTGQPFSAQRFNSILNAIKQCLDKARKDEKVPFNDLKVIEFIKESTVSTKLRDDGKVALTEEQVHIIYNMEGLSEAQANVRDMFVFQCLTSLRAIDTLGADFTAHKGKRVFEVIQTKEKGSENQKVFLDLDERIEAILDKHNWQFPEITESRYNFVIEQIIKKTPFSDDPVQLKVKCANGQVWTTIKPMHKVIKSHTGRRTLATNLLSKGAQKRDVRRVTGHSNDAMLDRYDKTSTETALENLLAIKGKSQTKETIPVASTPKTAVKVDGTTADDAVIANLSRKNVALEQALDDAGTIARLNNEKVGLIQFLFDSSEEHYLDDDGTMTENHYRPVLETGLQMFEKLYSTFRYDTESYLKLYGIVFSNCPTLEEYKEWITKNPTKKLIDAFVDNELQLRAKFESWIKNDNDAYHQ